MPGKTVNSAIVLLIVGNALAVISDVFVKILGSDTSIFQFILLRSLLTLLLLLPLYRQFSRQHFFAGFRIHALRSQMHLVGIFCMVIALTSLPLATANAVFYIAPILVMLLSVLLFREKLTPLSVFAVFSGFGGILVILRPEEFSWVAFSAVGAAIALAFNAVLVRKLPREQPTVHKLFLDYLLIIPTATVLVLWEGEAWDGSIFFSALGSAVFILGYNISVLLAYRLVDANRITSAEYTGLIWAIAIGWLAFGETPDLGFLLGSLMIILPLILIGWRQQRNRRIPRAQSHTLADEKLRD